MGDGRRLLWLFRNLFRDLVTGVDRVATMNPGVINFVNFGVNFERNSPLDGGALSLLEQ